MFHLSLPHESALRRWCSKVDCSPGFTEQSFWQLQAKVEDEKAKNREVFVQLVQDEMSIRKKIDFKNGQFLGCVDLGFGVPPDDTTPAATEAFVIMAVGVNSAWKIPLGYFMINSLNAGERATLIKLCANKLKEIGIQVVGLTCDAPATNLAMMSNLGVSLIPENPLTDFFPFDHSDEPVSIIFDACHMIKLVRNTFADCKTLQNGEKKWVEWKYIQALHNLQTQEGLHAANKLRKAHIEFHKQKMKVSLAAQTLSESVADGLKFCREELQLEEFKNSDATEEFIRVFNDAFDVLNSKNALSFNMKAPMRTNNEQKWRAVFDKTRKYILDLKLQDGTKVVNSRRKTGFLGFLVNFRSLENLFERLVRNGRLQFLLTYKLSQDHLELFFGCIRSKLGANNNPTTQEFSSTYKRLLLHGIHHGLHGNCFPQDDTQILYTSLKNSINLEEEAEKNRSTFGLADQEWDHDYVTTLSQLTSLTGFQQSVTEYIAGFVMRKAIKLLKCETCCSVLSKPNSNRLFKLVNIKDKGGLIRVSEDILRVCETTEICLKRILQSCQGIAPFSKSVLLMLSKSVLEIVSEQHP